VAEPEKQSAVESLAVACEAIAHGNFDDAELLFNIVADETVPVDIRNLAETFAGMMVQVEAREFHASQLIADLKETQRQLEAAQQQLQRENTNLKQRLKKLDVTFDETQADLEIKEIVETEYFRELQQRAKSLRSKFKQQADGESP
jgi:predicted nuclease with TOPRIM domain